jgi:hypothetical protein
MPIAVSCTCGKDFYVKEELAGKKIKCPGCQAVVQVPAGGAPTVSVQEPQPLKAEVIEDGPVVAKIVPKAASVVEDDFDNEPRKVSKKKKRRSDKQSSKTLLFVLAGGGVLLLGLCCIGGGILGYFLVLAGPGDPEKEIVGKWQYDGVWGTHIHFGTAPSLEFKADGSFNQITNNTAIRYDNGKWKVISKKGTSITVEVTHQVVHVHPGKEFSFPPVTETHYYIIPSHNELRKQSALGTEGGLRFKRI